MASKSVGLLERYAISSMVSLVFRLNGTLRANTVSVVATYANGRFSVYVPGYSASQALAATQGIFVRSTGAGNWHPPGSSPYTSGQTITLKPGWNLVAAPYPLGGLRTDTIASEAASCSVQEIAVYSGGSYQTWTPAMGSGGAFLVPAVDGMWMQCAKGGSWSPA